MGRRPARAIGAAARTARRGAAERSDAPRRLLGAFCVAQTHFFAPDGANWALAKRSLTPWWRPGSCSSSLPALAFCRRYEVQQNAHALELAQIRQKFKRRRARLVSGLLHRDNSQQLVCARRAIRARSPKPTPARARAGLPHTHTPRPSPPCSRALATLNAGARARRCACGPPARALAVLTRGVRAGSAIYIHMARHACVGRLPPPLRSEKCAAPRPHVWDVALVPGGAFGCVIYFNMSSADIVHGTVTNRYVL